MPSLVRVGAKAIVLMGGWLVASLPTLAAMALWRSYGGPLFAPELATVALGHVLNAGLTIALAAAASNADVTSFDRSDPDARGHRRHVDRQLRRSRSRRLVGAHGAATRLRPWSRISSMASSSSMPSSSRCRSHRDRTRPLGDLDATGAPSAIARSLESLALAALAFAHRVLGCTTVRVSWDMSEGRRNSFSRADEAALDQIHDRRSASSPTSRRKIPGDRPRTPSPVQASPSACSIDVRYDISNLHWPVRANRRSLRRSLVRARRPPADQPCHDRRRRTRYRLRAGRHRGPREEDRDIFRGYPLAACTNRRRAVFYGLWPVAVAATAFFVFRGGSS